MMLVVILSVAMTTACSREHPSVPFYRDASLTPEWLGRNVTESTAFHRVGAFALTDQNGQHVTDSALTNRVSVIHFFFARCAGVCPTTYANIERLLGTLPNEARVQVLSHSVTPESDSVPALREYAKMRSLTDSRWHLLTGKRDDIAKLAKESYFVNLNNGSSYGVTDLAHTETLVLVDGHGRLRGVYTGTLRLDVDRLGEDIKSVLAES